MKFDTFRCRPSLISYAAKVRPEIQQLELSMLNTFTWGTWP